MFFGLVILNNVVINDDLLVLVLFIILILENKIKLNKKIDVILKYNFMFFLVFGFKLECFILIYILFVLENFDKF